MRILILPKEIIEADMTKYQYDPCAFERRYRRVYREGAEFWEEPLPTESLVRLLHSFNWTKGLRAIDMGCGEGRDSIFLAKRGFCVTAVDVSRSAVQRAKSWSKREGLPIDFIVADVANLPIRNEIYELAINIACLHAIIDQQARDKHLSEAYRVLKRKGVYFSCNIGGDESISVEEFYESLGKKPGDLIPRRIKVQGKEKEVYLPVIAAWPKSKEQYLREFKRANFKIRKAYREDTRPLGRCWIIIAEKCS
jgi:ubiquinone/menaquinone biosynthesis C-methylase UbiE